MAGDDGIDSAQDAHGQGHAETSKRRRRHLEQMLKLSGFNLAGREYPPGTSTGTSPPLRETWRRWESGGHTTITVTDFTSAARNALRVHFGYSRGDKNNQNSLPLEELYTGSPTYTEGGPDEHTLVIKATKNCGVQITRQVICLEIDA